MVTISRIARTATLAAACLAASGCSQVEKLEDDGPVGGGIPAEVQRAFDDSCGTAGCHDSASAAAGLDLSAAAAPSIIGGPSTQPLPMVELGNINGSYLAIKMLETPPPGVTRVGSRMPLGGNFEGADSLIILGWIASGTPSDDGGSGTATTEPPAESSSGSGDPTKLCGLEDVSPDSPNPFDIGTAAGQIPPDVGVALSNNCGCHEVDEVIMGAFIYAGIVHFSTIAELQTEYSLDMGMSDPFRTGAARMLERVQSDENNRMPPPYYCDLGDGSVITEADRQLLVDWLTAGAPDAASWMQ
jgi:hypothetical protein